MPLSLLLLIRVASGQATMSIAFVDAKSGEPIPCRVELRDSKGRSQKSRSALYHPPWNIASGEFVFRGKSGDYTFDVFHGPEYSSGGGGFTLDRTGQGSDTVRLPRHADMLGEGWMAGDLLCYLRTDEAAAWLPAEGLHMAALTNRHHGDSASGSQVAPPSKDPAIMPAIMPAIDGPHLLPDRRWCNVGTYYDDRSGSGIAFHHWQPPAAVPDDVPSSRLLVMAKQAPQTHAEIVRLWARDAPVWLASGRVDSIQVLSEHVVRDGRPAIKLSEMFHPEPNMFQGPRGPGRLVENLYWQVLETGLRIPPSAGSGTGRSGSPLGYNRVYVAQATSPLSPESWWEGLRAGRSFVTNGPLLRATINAELPGHVFQVRADEKLTLDVALSLTVADPVEYVDVIFNGEAIYHARLDEYAKAGGKIPPLAVDKCGWIIIRVVTQNDATYRIATTAPFYVEQAGQSRVSRAACQMFEHWLTSSINDQTRQAPASAQLAAPYTSAALDFWRKRSAMANSD